MRSLDGVVEEQRLMVEQAERVAQHGDTAIAHAMELHRNLQGERNVWVLNSLGRRLDALSDRVDPVAEMSGVSLVDSARHLLGSDEPRSYLLLLGNPAEARELGGFAGGSAVVRVDDGQVSLTRADRPKVLNENATTPAAFTSAPPQRFLEHRPWLYAQNFTAMIDFPTLAQTLGDLFPEMSGSEIDGVVYVDSTALAALVGLVGEVHLEDADRTIRADEVSGFITIDQYDIEFESLQDREDFLGELIGAIFDAMLGPETELKLENLRPVLDAIREDRLMFAPLDDSQLSAMKALGIAGGSNER